MPRLVRWYYSDVYVFFPFLHEIFHSPILQRECFLSIAHDYNKKDPARARGTQQLASLTGGVMRPEGYLPTRGGPGRNPSTFSAPPWILALEVPPPHSIIFHPGGDEQASDKDPSRIPFHRIHPSILGCLDICRPLQHHSPYRHRPSAPGN